MNISNSADGGFACVANNARPLLNRIMMSAWVDPGQIKIAVAREGSVIPAQVTDSPAACQSNGVMVIQALRATMVARNGTAHIDQDNMI